MANYAYMSIEGSKSGNLTSGAGTVDSIADLTPGTHDDESVVFAFEQNGIRPVNPQSGSVAGQRKHMPCKVTKPLDKASPLLWQALASGESLTIEVKFYRTSSADAGLQHYFTIKFENAVLTDGKTILPNCLISDYETWSECDEWSFAYQSATWTHEIANTTATDNWQEQITA